MGSNIREKLVALGPRPDASAVQRARGALADIDARVARELKGCSSQETRAKIEDAGEQEKLSCKTVLWLEQLYDSYEVMLKNADIAGAGKAAERESRAEYVTRETQSAHYDSDDGMLNMSRLQLTRLSSDSSPFRSLAALDLSKNNLEVLPDFFGKLKNLKVLNVSGNALKSIPESLARCSPLEELDLSFNQLEFLPSTFGSSLPKLERLFLQLNKLSALPSALCNLGSLVHLEVQFNKLVGLPLNLGKLQRLRTLNASGNFSNLTSLPDSIGYAASLEFLDLSYNQITRLPISFGYLTKLRDLKLLQNPLVFPPMVVAEHSTKAIVEYMGEQLRSKLTLEDGDMPVAASSTLGGKSSSSLLFSRSPSWITELLGGMCRSTSPVLGGSATKFVGLRRRTDDV